MAVRISPEVANGLGCIDCQFFSPIFPGAKGGRCGNPEVAAATVGFEPIPLTPEGACVNKQRPYADVLADAFAEWLYVVLAERFGKPKSK